MLHLRTPFDDLYRHPDEAESPGNISRALGSAAVPYPNRLDSQITEHLNHWKRWRRHAEVLSVGVE